MTIKHTLKTILIICGLSIVAACKSSAPTLDPIVMLNYCKEPTTATLENLSKNYGSFINKSRKKGVPEFLGQVFQALFVAVPQSRNG